MALLKNYQNPLFLEIIIKLNNYFKLEFLSIYKLMYNFNWFYKFSYIQLLQLVFSFLQVVNMALRHLSVFQIFAINAMAGSIDLVYAVVGAYFIPAIYNLGLPPIYGPMLLSISPLTGMVFQSYLGSASDQCQCQWGRRRPFITGLSITCLIGLLLFPFNEDLTDLISESKLHNAFLIILVIVSAFLVDFSVGSLQVPVRAYLLDVLPQSQLKIGNTINTTCATLGAAIGFGIGAIPWSSVSISSNDFSFQVKFVCIGTFFIVALCTILTLCSVKEQNPLMILTTVEIH